MKGKKTLGINAFLNMTKSVMGMLFPLITFPYASRVLSVEYIGKVNYASSVVSYFALFAMLGIPVYATREGSRIRTNKAKLSHFVSEVYTLNVLASAVSFVILFYLISVTDIFQGYKILLIIYAFQIPLSVVGTDWINSIFEDYLYITVRTLLFQLLGLILIFFLVKDQNDYYKYAICLVITSYGAEMLNAFYTRKYCRKKLIFNVSVLRHVKPVVILFATNLAALIYTSADTTMLGLMTDDYNVGIYTTAAKVYGIFKQIAFAVVIVCLPRFSYIVANELKDSYEELANKFLKVILMLALPLACGIFFLSGSIVRILAGEEFLDAIYPLKLLSIATFFAILAYFIMQLILLPNKLDSVILKATAISGIFNILGNYFLIPKYAENAAAFTTVVSEFIVLVITWHFGRKIIEIRIERKYVFSVIIATLVMALVLFKIETMQMNAVLTLLIGFPVGSVVYFLILILEKNEIALQGIKFLKTLLQK